ncbi:tetratricopeptide repeat family protein, putative [Plasmodium ovale]|uniref:Tetratricopeptide repeat family protein, putative n=1 Tax=Plasmodium ovale TaxID=36330 RepID=A0A1C3KXB9_PLAOA|nr:tetratricopeptide repeat family protein, putative [Plasmodium ovale]
MEELLVQNVDEGKLEEMKNKGNNLFRGKKYEEALDVYMSVISSFCNGSKDSKRIKSVVKIFQREFGKSGKENSEAEWTSSGCSYDIDNVRNLFVKVCHNISLCYYFLGQFELSIEYCSYINDIDKEHFKSYHTLGLCYEKLKDFKKSIMHFDRCKQLLSKGMGGTNQVKSSKEEVNRINDKLKGIVKLAEESIRGGTITIDAIKKTITDEKSSEDEKKKMLHCIYSQKDYIVLKENIFNFLFDIVNGINCASLGIEKTCVYVIYRVISKRDVENVNIEKEKGKEEERDKDMDNDRDADKDKKKDRGREQSGKRAKSACIDALDDQKLQYYYDTDFAKILVSFSDIFNEEWLSNYVKSKTKQIENLKFVRKHDQAYQETVDILVYIINIIKYVHVINNENIIKIINLYYINSDNEDLLKNALSTIIFLCKKKKFLTQNNKHNKKFPNGKKNNQDILTSNQDILTSNQDILTSNQKVLTSNQDILTSNQKVLTSNQKVLTSNQKVLTSNQKVLTSNQKILTNHQENLKNNQVNISNKVIDYHFSDPYKYPLCINSEIKKLLQNCICAYDSFPDDVEYSLILLLTLLHDKNRPSEKDTQMNDLIYECVDLYFHKDEICIEWFVFIKCLFLVDKNIVLNYLIGKIEYILKILIFIKNSIGRKEKKCVSLYIDVLLLLLNISELRFMLSDHIDLYLEILKMMNYDQNFLKLLVGSFKLYMHNKEFKQEISKNVDLFFYSKEMIKVFLSSYDARGFDPGIGSHTPKVEKICSENYKREQSELSGESCISTCEGAIGTRYVKVAGGGKEVESERVKTEQVTSANAVTGGQPLQESGRMPKAEQKRTGKKECELVGKANTDTCASKGIVAIEGAKEDSQEEVQCGGDRGGRATCKEKHGEGMLKDIIEMLFYLSLHVEFKKQLLEEKNNYILFFLIKIGEDINKKKLDNTYKYIYCNMVNNLILTREDEKLRRREINKTNLSNFDNEQIEALEQFYDKLPNTVKPKIDPLYDYGDEETSNKLINLLLYSEKYQMNIAEKKDFSVALNCKYKNGAIVSNIYNFISSNFFTSNIAESICDIISKFVKNNNNIGTILVNNGLKTLLLASKHITNKKNCALALSEIFIHTNPKLIHFYEAYDSLSLLIDQLNNDEELLVFKSLMAITNILTIDENVAIKAMQLNLWNKCFDILSSENDYIRSASLECICNLCSQSHVHQYIYEKYQKIVGANDTSKEINFVDIQIIFAFTMEHDNYKALFASTGALGMLSSDLRLPFYLIRTKSFNHVFSSFQKTSDQNILLRILTFFNNIILSEKIPADVIKKIKDAVRGKTALDDENAQIAKLILQ